MQSRSDIVRIKNSAQYSSHFSIAVPEECRIPSSSSLTKLTIPPDHTFLPRLSAFLLPPPYTPSHPIYLHLAKVAKKLSDTARYEAEARVAKFAQNQLFQVEALETELKIQLDQLWGSARDGLRRAEHERDAISPHSIRRLSSPSRSGSISSSVPQGTTVVREFRPSTYHAHRSENRPHAVTTSGLSETLAATSHFPRSLHERSAAQSTVHPERQLVASDTATSQSPPPYASNPSSLGTGSDASPTSGISLVSNRPRSLARNMNVEQDTSVTYRYYVIEEQEKARARAKALDSSSGNAQKQGEQSLPIKECVEETVESSVTQPSVVGELAKYPSKPQSSKPVTEATEPIADTLKTPDKKSRKVTFDVKPDVVTIRRDIDAEKEDVVGSVLDDGKSIYYALCLLTIHHLLRYDF